MPRLLIVGLSEDANRVVALLGSAGESVSVLSLDDHTSGTPLEVRLDAAFADPDVEAVVIPSKGAEASLAARRAVQAGLRVLLSTPIEESLPVHYELAVIAEETGAQLVPLWPLLYDPCLQRLAEPDRSAGTVVRSVTVVADVPEADPLTSAIAVQMYALVQRIGGSVDRVQVVSLRTGEHLVVLGLQGGKEARIELKRAERMRRFVLGVNFGGDNREWAWDAMSGCAVRRGDTSFTESHSDEWLLQHLLRDFAAVTAPRQKELPTWAEALAGIHIADAAVESRERRRAVPVVTSLASRETVFRATMTTWGCGLLWLAVLALPLLGLLQFLGLKDTRPFAVGLLALLVMFLLAQLLRPPGRGGER